VGLLAVLFGLATVFFQTLGALPLYYREHFGLRENWIGMLFGLNALVVVAVEMVLVHRLEQSDHLRLVGWGCFLVCLGFGLMPLGATWAFAVVTVLVWTAGEMLALPFANSLVAARAGGADIGRYMGAYTALFAVAFVIAPAAGLWVYARVGGRALWTGVGVLGLALWAGCAVLAPRFRGRARPAEPTRD
jgi:MFS family permease